MITQGYLIGEVVRRVTGKSFGTSVKEKVAEKVGADFHAGVDPKEFERIADLVEANETTHVLKTDPDSIPGRVFSDIDITPENSTSTTGWCQAEIPAAKDHGNARSVAEAQTAMANGGKAFGVELPSEAGCRRALEQQTDGTNLALGLPVSFGMGYALRNE